jgi:hypothetical protein
MSKGVGIQHITNGLLIGSYWRIEPRRSESVSNFAYHLYFYSVDEAV